MTNADNASQAGHHARVRRQHNRELAEDYVEAIHVRLQQGLPVRVMDLQNHFGVSHVTVIRALQRFEKRGFLTRDGEEGIQLTDLGFRVAVESANRHALVVDFLKAIGVSAKQAEADAEGIEHHLSPETLKAMRALLDGSSPPIG
jgi:DtxR family manganese transport transcriptional regulator